MQRILVEQGKEMKNKEGLWKLSPSGLYGYTKCPSCFWIDNHYKKAPMLPLLLNSAMDLHTGLTPVAPLCSVLRHGELPQGHGRSDDPFFY